MTIKRNVCVEGYDYDYGYNSLCHLYLVLVLYPLRSLILVATCPCFTPGRAGAGGGILGLIFAGYVPLGFQNACPIIVYSGVIL